MAVGFVKALRLPLFLHKGLDHADTRDVLLNDPVEAVKTLLQNRKEGACAPDNEDNVNQNQRKGAGHDHAEAQIEAQKRRRAADKEHQAAHQTPDHLHDELLELGHVVGDAGDERAGGKPVGLLKAQMHDLFKAGLADIVAVVLPGEIGKEARTDAAETAQQHDEQHPDPGGDHQIQIGDAAAVHAQDPLVHDTLHHARLVEIHIDLRHHEARGQKRKQPVFFQMLP